jgi:hypothetical protein
MEKAAWEKYGFNLDSICIQTEFNRNLSTF